jgi:hypothetical protein
MTTAASHPPQHPKRVRATASAATGVRWRCAAPGLERGIASLVPPPSASPSPSPTNGCAPPLPPLEAVGWRCGAPGLLGGDRLLGLFPPVVGGLTPTGHVVPQPHEVDRPHLTGQVTGGASGAG